MKAKFKVDDGQHKKYILQNLGKKWKDNRSKLFNDIYDFDLSREQNLNLCPEGIDLDHWASFIDYRLKEKTLVIKLILNYLATFILPIDLHFFLIYYRRCVTKMRLIDKCK